jgi:nucleoside-diphosphate-sugar epimerase
MADFEDFPRQTVVVLGASGFVGSRLVQALRDNVEFRPVAAVRRLPRRAPWADVTLRACDATDSQAVADALYGVDHVVNCIAGNAKTMIAAARNLCEQARKRPPQRIIHLSSMAVYGQATGLVDETIRPVPPLNDYAEAKRVCEEIMQAYVRDGGNAVILRPGCIYGPGSVQWTARISRLLQAGRIGDLGAEGDGICNLTYIDDLIVAIQSALIRPGLVGEVFNIASADLPTWNEYFVRFARALSATPVRRLSRRRIDAECRLIAPILAIARRVARLARLPANRIPDPITPSLARLWRQDITLDTRRAVSRLDLMQTRLDHGLDASVRWLRRSSVAPAAGDGSSLNQTMELGRS